jgi:hypothetical protein
MEIIIYFHQVVEPAKFGGPRIMKVAHPVLMSLALLGLSAASRAAEPAEAATPAASSPFGWLTMPKVTMPKLTMPKIEMPKMPEDPLMPFKAGARKVSDGTKKAWEGTKEIFTFGSAPTANQTVRPTHPAAGIAVRE